MHHSLLALLFCLFGFSAAAQYAPFPYRLEAFFSTGDEIHSFKVDSIHADSLHGDSLFTYAKFFEEKGLACSAIESSGAAQPFREFIVDHNGELEFPVYSIVQPIKYNCPGDTLFSWQTPWMNSATDKIDWIFDTVLVESFLGYTDSIKVFSLQGFENGGVPVATGADTVQVWLSKNFGFIKWIDPWSLPAGEFKQMELVGFRTNNDTVGWRPPKFEAYFSFQAGDIFNWYEEHRGVSPIPPGPLQKRVWFTDSITYVTVIQDTLKLTWDRKKYLENWDDTLGVFLENYSEINNMQSEWHPDGFQYLLDAPTDFYAVGSDPLIYAQESKAIYFSSSYSIEVNGSDTTISRNFGSEGESFSENCEWGMATDIFDAFGMSTNSYSTGNYHANFATRELFLIGFQNFSGSSGDLTPAGIFQASKIEESIMVFPNPAHSIVFLKEFVGGEKFELFNTAGIRVKNGTYSPQGITVADLSPGIYLLKTNRNQNQLVSRVIVY